jgi:hypothetical protein
VHRFNTVFNQKTSSPRRKVHINKNFYASARAQLHAIGKERRRTVPRKQVKNKARREIIRATPENPPFLPILVGKKPANPPVFVDWRRVVLAV